jgi:hypothetical protein
MRSTAQNLKAQLLGRDANLQHTGDLSSWFSLEQAEAADGFRFSNSERWFEMRVS